MEVINWKLLTHPMNWIIILLMVFIGGIAFTFILSYFGAKQAPAQ